MYDILKIYYVFLIYSIFGKYLLNVPDVVCDALVIGFIFLSLQQDKFQLHIPRKLGNYCFYIIVVPALIILCYSVCVQLFLTLSSDYLVRSTTLCIRWVLYCLLALRTVYVFKDKSADMLLVSCFIAYIPSILVYFIQNGIVNGINLLLSEEAYNESVVLEVHRVTYVFGFLSVYYFYQWFISKKKVLPQTILSIVLLMLGVKRVANFAFVLVVVFIFLIKILKSEKLKYRFVCVASCLFVSIALLFVLTIKNGYLQFVFNYFGIEDNFRFNFWNHISPKYKFSPTFLGNGISYTQRFMWYEWSNIKDLSAVTNLHNDILSYYIGLGFVGFLMFFGLFFIGQVVLSKKLFSTKSAVYVFLLSVYYFIIMATSNEGLPGFVYGCYMMLILAVASVENVDLNEKRLANE